MILPTPAVVATGLAVFFCQEVFAIPMTGSSTHAPHLTPATSSHSLAALGESGTQAHSRPPSTQLQHEHSSNAYTIPPGITIPTADQSHLNVNSIHQTPQLPPGETAEGSHRPSEGKLHKQKISSSDDNEWKRWEANFIGRGPPPSPHAPDLGHAPNLAHAPNYGRSHHLDNLLQGLHGLSMQPPHSPSGHPPGGHPRPGAGDVNVLNNSKFKFNTKITKNGNISRNQIVQVGNSNKYHATSNKHQHGSGTSGAVEREAPAETTT